MNFQFVQPDESEEFAVPAAVSQGIELNKIKLAGFNLDKIEIKCNLVNNDGNLVASGKKRFFYINYENQEEE